MVKYYIFVNVVDLTSLVKITLFKVIYTLGDVYIKIPT